MFKLKYKKLYKNYDKLYDKLREEKIYRRETHIQFLDFPSGISMSLLDADPVPPNKIILDEYKLTNDYLPKKLPHRESQIAEIVDHLKPIFQGEENIVRVAILDGPIGTGKTAVARSIGEKLKEYVEKRKIPPIAYSHVNCQSFNTKFQVMRKIGKDLGLNIPRKGFSTQEVTEYIVNFLDKNQYNLFLVIDETDVLVRHPEGNNVLYTLLRLGEIYGNHRFGLAIAIIFRNYTVSVEYIDKSILSSFNSRFVKFNPYTSRELESILEARIVHERAIREEAVNDEIITMIADAVGYDPATGKGYGDARMAIKILWFAARRAEREGRSRILPEDVRDVINRGVLPTIYDREFLQRLQLHEKLLLLAVARTLMLNRERAYVSMGVVKLEYEDLCERYGIRPLGHTSIWERIQKLRTYGLIETKVDKGRTRGRTTRIQIPEQIGISKVPLDLLEKTLKELIERELS